MFPTVQQYVNYLKSILKVGWKVRMMTDDDLVREGDEGVVRKFKDNDEPGGLVEVIASLSILVKIWLNQYSSI